MHRGDKSTSKRQGFPASPSRDRKGAVFSLSSSVPLSLPAVPVGLDNTFPPRHNHTLSRRLRRNPRKDLGAHLGRGSRMIISRTPFRISFFGGGTDYPSWYRQHGGAVLAATIDKYCYLTCRHLPPFFEHRIRVVYRKIENVQDGRRDQPPGGAGGPAIPRLRPRPRAAPRRRPAGPQRHGVEFGVHRRPAARPVRPARRDADQEPAGPREHPHRTGIARRDGRLAGPGDGRLRRPEARHNSTPTARSTWHPADRCRRAGWRSCRPT